MIYEKELKKCLANNKQKFEKAFLDYKNLSIEKEKEFLDWKNRKDLVLSLLKKEIENIENPYFKNLIIEQIEDKTGIYSANHFDFSLFCYFIDRLNNEIFNKKIMKYNEKYCLNIARKIADEYKKIISYIETVEIEHEKMPNIERNKTKEIFIELWDSMFTNDINKIAEKEYETIITNI